MSTRVPTIPRYDVTGSDAGMTPTHSGDYVCYDDFAKLERELAEAEACSIRLKVFIGEQKTKHETEIAAEKAKISDPHVLHSYCLRHLTDAQIAHLFGEQMTAIQNDRDTLAAQVATLREALENAKVEFNRLFAALPVMGPLPSPSVMQEVAYALQQASTPETKHPDTERLDHVIAEFSSDDLRQMPDYPGRAREFIDQHRAAIDAARKSTPSTLSEAARRAAEDLHVSLDQEAAS